MSKIFLHVPKTAGTSLLVALRRHLRQDELLEYYENQPGKSFAEIRPRAARARLVYGHASHGIHQGLGVAPRYGIILREPVARVRSLYHYMARDPQSEHHDRFRQGLSLADFVELRLTNQTRNHMTQIAAGIESDVLDEAVLWQAQDNLSCFDYVGILEALDRTALEAFLGVPPLEIGQHNVGSYAREPLSGRDRSVVERCNAYDLELYRHAVGLARSRRRAAGRRFYDLGASPRRSPEPVAEPRPEPLPESPVERPVEPVAEPCASRMSRAERATRTCLEETAEVATLRERARQQERLVLALGALLAEQREHRRRAEAALLDREAAIEAVIATVRASRSWRLTRPLRRLRGASADDIPVPAAPARAPAAPSASPGRAALEATGLFDVAWYIEENTDVALLADDPLEHYLVFGAAEGRSPHPLFDPAFYGAQQPGLPAGANPLLHYCTEGAAALRDPGPLFSTSFYLEANPDVRQSGMNPLWHFCEHGLLEGRRPHPDLRPALPQLAPFDPARPREAVRWLARRAKAAGLAEARLAAAKRLWRQQAEAQLAAFLRGAARLALPRAARPRLSVILVLYNQAALTLDCLRALAAGGGPPMETIIVDNGSTDETVALLRRLDGARILRNPGNPGYAAAVNQAAGVAAGEFLLLLNNDALVEPGAIQAAMAAIERSADIGAVGGRVLLADGTLQEAGCLVWSDGGCHGYGRGDDPERGEYRFRREVDFCS
ncbi:MAG: glycosyltransferase, partial [Dongiaceae bacterium]